MRRSLVSCLPQRLWVCHLLGLQWIKHHVVVQQHTKCPLPPCPGQLWRGNALMRRTTLPIHFVLHQFWPQILSGLRGNQHHMAVCACWWSAASCSHYVHDVGPVIDMLCWALC